MYDLGERDLLAEIEYKIFLVMLSLVCNHVNCTNCCFLYPSMGPLYENHYKI